MPDRNRKLRDLVNQPPVRYLSGTTPLRTITPPPAAPPPEAVDPKELGEVVEQPSPFPPPETGGAAAFNQANELINQAAPAGPGGTYLQSRRSGETELNRKFQNPISPETAAAEGAATQAELEGQQRQLQSAAAGQFAVGEELEQQSTEELAKAKIRLEQIEADEAKVREQQSAAIQRQLTTLKEMQESNYERDSGRSSEGTFALKVAGLLSQVGAAFTGGQATVAQYVQAELDRDFQKAQLEQQKRRDRLSADGQLLRDLGSQFASFEEQRAAWMNVKATNFAKRVEAIQATNASEQTKLGSEQLALAATSIAAKAQADVERAAAGQVTIAERVTQKEVARGGGLSTKDRLNFTLKLMDQLSKENGVSTAEGQSLVTETNPQVRNLNAVSELLGSMGKDFEGLPWQSIRVVLKDSNKLQLFAQAWENPDNPKYSILRARLSELVSSQLKADSGATATQQEYARKVQESILNGTAKAPAMLRAVLTIAEDSADQLHRRVALGGKAGPLLVQALRQQGNDVAADAALGGRRRISRGSLANQQKRREADRNAQELDFQP